MTALKADDDDRPPLDNDQHLAGALGFAQLLSSLAAASEELAKLKLKVLEGPAQLERFGDRLYEATMNARDSKQIAVSVAALALTTAGTPPELHQILFRRLSEEPNVVEWMRMLWRVEVACFPYLRDVTRPLMEWMVEPSEEQVKAAQKVWGLMAGLDWLKTLEVNRGEILGPLYQHYLAPSVRKARSVFYTPMTVSEMIAEMQDPQEGQSILDPTCGCGGMLVAVVRVMRRHGRRPETCLLAGKDIDPLAAALAAINLAALGMPNVRIECGNSLTDWPLFDDTLQLGSSGRHPEDSELYSITGKRGRKK